MLTIPKPTLEFTPSLPVNARNRINLYGNIAMFVVAAVMTAITVANAGEVRYHGTQRAFVTLQPATVAGIRPPPVPREYYRHSVPQVFPDARVVHLATSAPANSCGPNKFEVLNGTGPRCVGD
jgi:hypothetical protein